MEIKTKFSLGDKGFMILQNKVTMVFVVAIETNSMLKYEQDHHGKRIPKGGTSVQYRVQREQPKTGNNDEDNRINRQAWEEVVSEYSLFITKQEMAEALGIL